MAQVQFDIGLIVERLEPSSPWGTALWLPVQVLEAVPATPPWTVIAKSAGRERFFAGAHSIALYANHSPFYADNLSAERPRLWVAMRPDASGESVEVIAVTADPTEGEGYTETGTNIVETLEMPAWLAGEIAAFCTQNHVERTFEKRKRDKRLPQVLERKRPID